MKLMHKNGAYMHAYNVNDEKTLRAKGWKLAQIKHKFKKGQTVPSKK